MLWLEMSRDVEHGGGSWGFTQSLWSPTRKQTQNGDPGGRWPFWDNLLRVRAGDIVVHLRGEKNAAFVGFSIAESDGAQTAERPPVPGPWAYDTRFYRVPLKEFQEFPTPLLLSRVFTQQGQRLRDYFERNKKKPVGAKHSIFFVIQADRLQCLNGAYLSEVDEELEEILFGPELFVAGPTSHPATSYAEMKQVETSEKIQLMHQRVGQQAFAERVRDNYHMRCCFPNCPFAEARFLIGSHIARWADVPALRGNLGNGLCLCLVHDKAFELGLFTVNRQYCITVHRNHPEVPRSTWCATALLPYDGHPIRRGDVLPLEEALEYHWKRINIVIPA